MNYVCVQLVDQFTIREPRAKWPLLVAPLVDQTSNIQRQRCDLVQIVRYFNAFRGALYQG